MATYKISVYEEEFIQALEKANRVQLTAENLHQHIDVFNHLYEKGMMFINKMSLRKHVSRLAGVGIEREEAASFCAAHVLFEHLDYMLNPGNPVETIKLINNTVGWRVNDLIEKARKAQNDGNTKKVKPQKEEAAPAAERKNEIRTKKGKTAAPFHDDWTALAAECEPVDISTLNPGDMIVHNYHGLGRFDGMERMRVSGKTRQYLKIAYADDTVFVPVDHLETVAKYMGSFRAVRPLDNTEESTKAHASTANVHMDIGWDLVPSDLDLEEMAMTGEQILSVLKALKLNANAYEVVSFLGTKVIREKAGALQKVFDSGSEKDKQALCSFAMEVITAHFKDIVDHNFFRDAAFVRNDGKYNITVKGNVSHASERAQEKVKKHLKLLK
ncbi:MAG: hypothetical protein IKJ99_06140 [Oscillospiraceae bacterium]|nr:hypothetical protein [Oscillospiraceae bacterium]